MMFFLLLNFLVVRNISWIGHPKQYTRYASSARSIDAADAFR
jgi:hypothetical protein